MKAQKINIEQDPAAPVEKTVLAKAIVGISSAVSALQKSGLNRKAIVILASHSAKQPQYVVHDVINALDQLKKDYCS